MHAHANPGGRRDGAQHRLSEPARKHKAANMTILKTNDLAASFAANQAGQRRYLMSRHREGKTSAPHQLRKEDSSIKNHKSPMKSRFVTRYARCCGSLSPSAPEARPIPSSKPGPHSSPGPKIRLPQCSSVASVVMGSARQGFQRKAKG